MRCPGDGRKVAWLEVDDTGTTWLHTVGGKRGDLAKDADWQRQKTRATWLGVLDVETGEPVAWERFESIPTPQSPAHVEPSRQNLSEVFRELAGQRTAVGELWLDVLFAVPRRAVCPRCHRVLGVQLSVSKSGSWDAVLA